MHRPTGQGLCPPIALYAHSCFPCHCRRGIKLMAYVSIFSPGLFAGQTIIVTGGGSGIGRCTAHELSHLGAKVVLIGRKEEKLIKVAEEINEDGGEALWFSCNIRSEDEVQA